MVMENALLVVFEGIDGAGKSTQIARLAAFVTALGLECVCSREPTMGQYGRQLRESAQHARMPVQDEHRLLMLDRREHLDSLVRPALARGAVVILDRYYFSSVAYQSGGELSQTQILEDNEAFAPKPDLLFILDLPVETSAARIGQRGQGRDAFESTATLIRCREVFLGFSALDYAHLVDASLEPAQIARRVRQFFIASLLGKCSSQAQDKLRLRIQQLDQSGDFTR